MFSMFNWFPVESALKQQPSLPNTNTQQARLINHFKYLNGNYDCLFDATVERLTKSQFVMEQLRFYINRFFSWHFPNLALGGGDYQDIKHLDISSTTEIKRDTAGNIVSAHYEKRPQGCELKRKTNFHYNVTLAIPKTNLLASHRAVCLLYFVETIDELKEMHEKTMIAKRCGFIDWDGFIPPPIILIVQDPKSPLLTADIVKNQNILIFDVWHVPNLPYHQFKSLAGEIVGKALDNDMMEAFFHKLCAIYYRLAVMLNLTQKNMQADIFKAQTEFFLSVQEAEKSGALNNDVSTLMGSFLFDINVQRALYGKPFSLEQYEKEQMQARKELEKLIESEIRTLAVLHKKELQEKKVESKQQICSMM